MINMRAGMTRYHYRGMLTASSFRWSAAGSPFSPLALWQLWDSFSIAKSEMIGWWEDVEQGNGTVPIQTSNPNFKVTCYIKKGEQTMVVLAGFSNGGNTEKVSLDIDWVVLGLSPITTKLTVPSLPPFQTLNTGAHCHAVAAL
jgi:hypothetical protein